MSANGFSATEALDGAMVAALNAPLSRKKAMLVALLVDAALDEAFARRTGGDDILAFREELASRSAALRLVLDLVAMRTDGPSLVLEAVEVPIRDYGRLKVEDFMVSLYNDHTVQRVMIALPDGGRRDGLELLAEAVRAVREVPSP
jgi:hypothetical protein